MKPAAQRPNLGLTVNGKPLDSGAGLWAPHFDGATSREARVTVRWKGMDTIQPPRNPRTKRLPKAQRTPPPTRTEMLARLKAGLG